MIAAATNRASAAGRRWAPALAGVGIVVLGVTACGGGAGNSATPAATIASSAAPGSSPSPSAGQAAFPGVVGTAAAISGSSLEVQNPTSGQVTVTFTASTPITDTVSVTAKDVTVGSCVTVVGKPSTTGSAGSPVTATTVTISAPVKGNCAGAGGFGGGGFGGFGGGGTGGAGASPRPSFSARPRPTGSRGAFGNGTFGGANGKVTSISATGFVVQAMRRTAGSSTATETDITVITSSASKYLKTVTASASALKVGLCITAVGTANSIGAVAARSIRVSQPGPSGCVTGFGGRGGFGGFGGSGRPSANA
jgi:hypothetical protein